MVSVNHRLNALGYLNLAEYGPRWEGSANVGALDLVAALEWVRDNIGNFGGDPANVMIFGQSGGGGKVSVLMAMPAAKGLFHGAGRTQRLVTATDGAGGFRETRSRTPGGTGPERFPDRSVAEASCR